MTLTESNDDSTLDRPPLLRHVVQARPTKIYVASKVLHAPMWRTLRAAGAHVVSTWIDEDGPGQTKDYAEFWTRIVEEIRRADALLFLAMPDEDHSGGTPVEAGIALGLQKPIALVGMPKKGTWINHPLVARVSTLRHGLQECGIILSPAFYISDEKQAVDRG
ncbi:MAG: hypothetical protein ACHREM_00425 [Polyangiales bacterium]